MKTDQEQAQPLELQRLHEALTALTNAAERLLWRLDEHDRCRWTTEKELNPDDPGRYLAELQDLNPDDGRLIVRIEAQPNHRHRPQVLWTIAQVGGNIEERYNRRHIIPLREAATGTAIQGALARCPDSPNIDWQATRGNITLQGSFNANTPDLEIRNAVETARDQMSKVTQRTDLVRNARTAQLYWMYARNQASDAAEWIAEAKANAAAMDFVAAHRTYNQATCIESTHRTPTDYPAIEIRDGRSLKPGFLVRSTQCPTCIYHPLSPNRPKDLEDKLRDDRGYLQGYRVCHTERQTNICCRGFWNRNKDHFPLGQIAQRLDLVIEVESETDAYVDL